MVSRSNSFILSEIALEWLNLWARKEIPVSANEGTMIGGPGLTRPAQEGQCAH